MNSLDIYNEIERFQFVLKRLEGELDFLIIRERISDLSALKRETQNLDILLDLQAADEGLHSISKSKIAVCTARKQV